jgi:hypothetical protein
MYLTSRDDSPTLMQVIGHPSEIELQRLADDGEAAVDAQVVEHVRTCHECTNTVRYTRAAVVALRSSLSEHLPPEEVLLRVIQTVSGEPSSDATTSTAAPRLLNGEPPPTTDRPR